MVYPRCIAAVESILHRFNLSVVSISLGEATVAEDIDGNINTALETELEAIGFELHDSPHSIIVENIKTAVIEWVRITDSRPKLSEGNSHPPICFRFGHRQEKDIARSCLG